MLNPHSMRYVTLSGLPLRFDFTWPFRAAEAGSDWFVVHGIVGLDDGGNSGLQAEVAVNMSQTIREALPSLDGEMAAATELLRSQAERFEAEKQRGLAAAAGRTKVSA